MHVLLVRLVHRVAAHLEALHLRDCCHAERDAVVVDDGVHGVDGRLELGVLAGGVHGVHDRRKAVDSVDECAIRRQKGLVGLRLAMYKYTCSLLRHSPGKAVCLEAMPDRFLAVINNGRKRIVASPVCTAVDTVDVHVHCLRAPDDLANFCHIHPAHKG